MKISKSDWSWIIATILIIIGIILFATKSNAQISVFNYRDTQVGDFHIILTTDSVTVYEHFKYIEDNKYWKLYHNEFSEPILMTSKGHMYMEVYTEHNRYVMFYCDADKHDFIICNVYIHQEIGDTLHYTNK